MCIVNWEKTRGIMAISSIDVIENDITTTARNNVRR